MAYDIVIKNGQIIDGTGAGPVQGDLAIKDGVIVAVGDVDGAADREIDAEGHYVTPGFVDVHTHLDAQIGWDPLMTPVSWHGVTTALLGNCGVTFAPCKSEDKGLLAGMMETVEDIPRDAILGGLPWDWEHYGEYLDSIDKLDPALNIAGMIGHCALRFYVMGERAVEEQATDDEKVEMAKIVGKAVDDGAVGFSSNRFPNHVLPDGRSIPGTFADHDELLHIAREIGPRKALMQNVMDFAAKDLGNYELLGKLADETQSRILFSFGAGAHPESGKRNASMLESLNTDGRDISALSIPRGSGFVFGLQAAVPSSNVWGRRGFFGDTWRELSGKSFEDRLAFIQSADVCEKLVAEAKAYPQERYDYYIKDSYWMGNGESPDYTVDDSQRLYAIADAAGEHWSETYLRLMRETNGKGLFTWRMYNQNLDALSDLLANEHVLPGLSDAGAHVSQVMDSGVSSFILSHWTRDAGLYSWGEGVRRLTSGPARIIGLKDRGVLKQGLRADVNVFDPDRIGEQFPVLVHDFPGGAPRYIQRSHGYKATIVNGVVSLLDGELTGERAGRVLRHQA